MVEVNEYTANLPSAIKGGVLEESCPLIITDLNLLGGCIVGYTLLIISVSLRVTFIKLDNMM